VPIVYALITSAKEGCVFIVVCLSVCLLATLRKSFLIGMKFAGKVGSGPMKKWLNFGDDSDHRLNTVIVFRIRHYWEIRKVV